MSLIARYFEARGLPTLILGSALDILQAGQPPRAAFLNYPLGFESGIAFDARNQLDVLKASLPLFDSMTGTGIQALDFEWEEGWQMVDERGKTESGQDLRSHRDLSPRYQSEEDRMLAEGSVNGTGNFQPDSSRQ